MAVPQTGEDAGSAAEVREILSWTAQRLNQTLGGQRNAEEVVRIVNLAGNDRNLYYRVLTLLR